MNKSITVICILLLWFSAAFADDAVLLGVIEQPQACGEKKAVSARILFHKSGKDWHALGVSPISKPSTTWDANSIKWTVAFDGKNIGSVRIQEPTDKAKYINDWLYHRDKFHKISSESSPPYIKNKSKLFSGWCSTPEVRPLVIVSKPNFKDPDHWKPFTPNDSYKKKLFPFLRVVVGKSRLLRCENPDDNVAVPYDFKANETIFYKSYKSASNDELVSFGLDPKIINCSDGIPSHEWLDNWFLIKNNEIDYVGREMQLIDAGDYDGDGKSELLFWYSGYNNDGYILFYNNFRGRSEYLWGYH